MARLCQIVALESGIRNREHRTVTDAWKQLQKPALLSGISRVYQPRADDGEPLPAENTRVQVTVESVIEQSIAETTRLLDITATRDYGNCVARADVKVAGVEEPLLRDVPVVYLIFLAKQIQNLRDIIARFPVHDQADRWVPAGGGVYRTDPPVTTYRERKVPRNHVKDPGSDRHPAQVDVYFENVVVGEWTATKFTGGITVDRHAELLRRVDALAAAVSDAREEANSMHVEDVSTGGALLGWLFR
jgi:hypothetical protein